MIFLDQRMPDGDGLSVLEPLAEKWPRAAIFLMTGQADDVVAKSAILLGATDYIPKRSISRNAVERLLKTGRDAAEMRWKVEQQQEILTFAHVLVHDFRAPIVQANSITELLEESINDGDQDAIQTELALLHKSTGPMSELIDSLSSHIRNDRAAEMEVSP
ncbi:response regulator [Pseudooceanicola spongiae]|uniref:Response regulator n=1 Tax=Pseudooceanicola spongiae TaxID=2613965 RepID=A0A7L9WJF5_9RHOB|nr:response regulator [Pseudooceanicola spongiae]QOL80521.1 response regulator [Pseudooceanicola spongiae]